MNWICAQIGAREHYAIPRVLHRAGKLDSLYTDFWATTGWRILGKLAGKSNLTTRYHSDLKGAAVTAFNFQSLEASRQRFINPYEGFLQVGEAFGRRVVGDLQSTNSQLSVASSQIFFSYDTGFLEPARWVKKRDVKAIVCQIDPARYEVDLVKKEEKRWPGWSRLSADAPESYFRRRESEWAVADLVIVNSEWSKQALMKQGVPEDKIVIVPLAYESIDSAAEVQKGKGDAPSRNHPLRVLFLGQVILRKGIQYLIEAAKLLKGEAIHFDVVGPIGISDEALSFAPSNMTFHGAVTRDRTREFYDSANLFVLPTLSDGFALTQLEAMTHGLPVIATPNCGEVVSDGVDGLIVPASDSSAIAEAIQLLIQDPMKLRTMSVATAEKLEQFSLGRLGENLAALEKRLLKV
jgi:glycosyltransferase involved in cell wall biosynthesis